MKLLSALSALLGRLFPFLLKGWRPTFGAALRYFGFYPALLFGMVIILTIALSACSSWNDIQSIKEKFSKIESQPLPSIIVGENPCDR